MRNSEREAVSMQCEGVQLPARRSNLQPRETAWVAFEPQ